MLDTIGQCRLDPASFRRVNLPLSPGNTGAARRKPEPARSRASGPGGDEHDEAVRPGDRPSAARGSDVPGQRNWHHAYAKLCPGDATLQKIQSRYR